MSDSCHPINYLELDNNLLSFTNYEDHIMKLGIIIYSNDSEIVWNAFRLSSFSLKKGDEVEVFLLGKGVESETLDTHKFNVSAEMKQFRIC